MTPRVENAGAAGGHIVMLPFMAHGHLIPFLSLARILHRHTDFTITLATTPLNVQYLRSTLSASGGNGDIRLAELSFCSADHDLPPGMENTENLPLDKLILLFNLSTSLARPFEQLLLQIEATEGQKPTCIVFDVLFGWSVEMARRLGIKCFSFITGGAYGTLAYISLWQHLPHRLTDSDEFSLAGFPQHHRFERSQLQPFLRAADGTDPWSMCAIR